MALYVLFEHAAGYALFKSKEFEEVGMFLPQVEESIKDSASFSSVVSLVSFFPYKTALNALENINAVSEGVLHEDLQLLLETNLPKISKKHPYTLGVSDAKLGAAIQESISCSVQTTGVVSEIIRGIRVHFAKLVTGFTVQSAGKAQLGLGHSYSRGKVKFNVHRSDNMIIQSIALLDQLDKDINTFSMRIREWYSYHFPELIKIVPDNYTFVRSAEYIKNRKEMTDEMKPGLEEIVMDEDKVEAIFKAAKMSMGMDISVIDLINIERFAGRVVALCKYRIQLQDYLRGKMHDVAPNLAVLIGEVVGARLISHAGSLTSLAKYPASTVQILGAEKALFRALKTRSNTPKYGLLYHSTFIGKAATANKGRISRYLANKCSIASRIDCFSEQQCDIYGQRLKAQVEERLKFYETGDLPRKNQEVMEEALKDATEYFATLNKKKKKKKKRSIAETNGDADESVVTTDETPKKKKKKKNKDLDESLVDATEEEATPAKKKKVKPEYEETVAEPEEVETETPKKKKKKKKSADVEPVDVSMEVEASPEKKKKKKKKVKEDSD